MPILDEQEVRAALYTVSAQLNITTRIYPEFELAKSLEENQTSSTINTTIEQSSTASTNESTVVTMPSLDEQNQTLSRIRNTTGPTKTFETTIIHSTKSNAYQDNYGLVCMPPSKCQMALGIF